MRRVAWFVIVALLAGCGSKSKTPDMDGQTVLNAARAAWAARKAPPAPKITATRAQLAAAGLDAAPLLVARMPAIDSESGFFYLGLRDGTELWQSGDGQASLRLRASGPVVASVGLGYDLYGADTAPLEAALAAGAGSYGRRYRHLGADLTTLETRQVVCTLTDAGPETIEIFQRRHATQLYIERCEGAQPHPDATAYAFENRFWIGRADRILWASEQWMSQDLGTIRLERVFP